MELTELNALLSYKCKNQTTSTNVDIISVSKPEKDDLTF